jgi:hypothetical protein
MVRKAIVDLFLNVKIRSQEQIAAMNETVIEQEKKKLHGTDTIDILDYIKQSIEILMHMRIEEFELFKKNWEMQESLRQAELKEEKERVKRPINTGNEQKESKLMEKVRQELISTPLMSSCSSLQPSEIGGEGEADPEREAKKATKKKLDQ